MSESEQPESVMRVARALSVLRRVAQQVTMDGSSEKDKLQWVYDYHDSLYHDFHELMREMGWKMK